MAQNTEPPAAGASREVLLDRGYDALNQGSWAEAVEIFDRLLKEDPHCGLSCLGRAMVFKKIHSREELAENWEALGSDPDFRKALEPAKPDFLIWLQKDMEAANGKEKRPEDHGQWELQNFSSLLPDLSSMGKGRKLLLIFSGIQVLLYLGVTSFCWMAQPECESILGGLFGSLVVAAMVSGIPVILGPVYGNSIVEAGRFEKLLKFLNNFTAVVGGVGCSVLSAAGYLSIQDHPAAAREDIYYFMMFLLSAIMYFWALLFPKILDKVEYG